MLRIDEREQLAHAIKIFPEVIEQNLESFGRRPPRQVVSVGNSAAHLADSVAEYFRCPHTPLRAGPKGLSYQNIQFPQGLGTLFVEDYARSGYKIITILNHNPQLAVGLLIDGRVEKSPHVIRVVYSRDLSISLDREIKTIEGGQVSSSRIFYDEFLR